MWKARLALAFLTCASISSAQTCDKSLAKHIYNPQRLVVQQGCVTVTGTLVDATHGKRKQGCRVEKDGDYHCWLKLDPGQEQYINAKNKKNEGGNLVYEPICQHTVTQPDAISACKGFHQQITIPPIGSHVSITGMAILDTQHGHKEIHPPSRIDVIP